MRHIKIITFIFLLISISSCTRDKGNYDYHNINEISISSLESSYSVITGVTDLKITPDLAMTEKSPKDSDFDFFWIIKQGSEERIIDTIGRNSTLNYRVSLIPGSYVLHFRVLDKKTNVVWKANTQLVVGTPYSRGLMLVGTNEDGNADVDMITMVLDTVIVSGILKQSGLPPLQDPVSIVHTGVTAGVNNAKLWVLTNSGSYYLNRETMKGSVEDRFGKMAFVGDNIDRNKIIPIIVAPQIRNMAGSTGGTFFRAHLCKDGNIYGSALLSSEVYSSPLNRASNNVNKLLKAAPYLLYPINSMGNVTWYDIENHRFMSISSLLNTSSNILVDKEGDPFPWNQAGTSRKLIYAENSRNTDGGSTNGNSFAILRDDNNQSYIYKFYAQGTPQKRAVYTIKSLANDFNKASFYAFSSNRTVVFYTVGNKLFAYDYNPGNERIYQFPEIGTDEITMLKFDTQIDHLTNALYIATYNSNTKGTLRKFILGSNPDVVTISQVANSNWSGLIKIKDMNWRAVN